MCAHVVKDVISGIRLPAFEYQLPCLVLRGVDKLLDLFQHSFLICKMKALKFLFHGVAVRIK